MHRIFLGLAVTDGSLLVASFVAGLLSDPNAVGGGSQWRIHFLLGLMTTMTTLLVHSIVFTYFLGTGKWVQEVARVYRLPEWVYQQAVKNKRKAFPFELWGMTTIAATAWVGAAANRGVDPAWHLGLAALTMAFNLGAFVVEYGAIVGQARLLLEVKDQADRLREAQLAATAPASADHP